MANAAREFIGTLAEGSEAHARIAAFLSGGEDILAD
jgi:hypothetical protein